MATIADNIAELMRIRLEMKEFAKIPDDVPFEQYGAWLAWAGEKAPAQPLMADFVNKRYSMDGVPCRFEFERLSKAWQFEHRKLEDYGVNEPRFSGKGLLIEPMRTNYVKNDFRPEFMSNITFRGNTSTPISSPSGSDALLVSAEYQLDKGDTSYVVDLYQSHGNTHLAPKGEDLTHSIFFLPKNPISRYPITPPDGAEVRDRDVHLQLGAITHYTNLNIHQPDLRWERMSVVGKYGGGNYHIHLSNRPSSGFDPAPDGSEKIGLWGLQIEDGLLSSYIPTSGTPTTRTADHLAIPVPTGQTIVADMDEGVTYEIEGGEAVFSGHGYIRSIRVESE